MNYVLKVIMGCFPQLSVAPGLSLMNVFMATLLCTVHHYISYLHFRICRSRGTDGVSITVTLPAELAHTIQSHCCIIYEGQTLVGMGGVTVGPITWWFIFNEVNRPSRSSGAWHTTTEGGSCPSGVWLLLALMSITVIEFLQDH